MPIDMLTWKGNTLQILPLDKEFQQLINAERGKTTLSQGWAPNWLCNMKGLPWNMKHTSKIKWTQWLYLCIYVTITMEERGHEFERECRGRTWEELEGGKGWGGGKDVIRYRAKRTPRDWPNSYLKPQGENGTSAADMNRGPLHFSFG